MIGHYLSSNNEMCYSTKTQIFFVKTASELSFGSFPKTAPVKIPEGWVATSGRLRRVEENISKSSQPLDGLQCIFCGFAPTGFLV